MAAATGPFPDGSALPQQWSAAAATCSTTSSISAPNTTSPATPNAAAGKPTEASGASEAVAHRLDALGKPRDVRLDLAPQASIEVQVFDAGACHLQGAA